MKIKVGSREIGDGCPPFVIAEVGSNWRNFEDCKDAVVKAKQCGADAVKFQLFTHSDLYGLPDCSIQPHALNPDWLPKLKEKADACGIEFMCSAFSPELYDAVDPYVNIHKVASAECNHLRILEKLRSLGKPVILSTGAHGAEDIGMALKVLGDLPAVLMYCEAAYPARMIHFGKLADLKDRFGTLVGYSDHSTDALVVPVASTAYEACVIEKHVSFIDADTPDAPHSLTADEFKAMVVQIRGGAVGRLGPSPQEKDMALRHNRRLIATRDIKQGAAFKEGENFGIYRSLKDDTHAFHPFMAPEVNGKIAKRAIIAGDGIGPGDI